MSRHPIVGDSPFLKRVLIPFWVVRILFMVVEIGIYGLAIGVISASRNNLQKLSKDYGIKADVTGTISILVVVMVIILLCLILDLVCIIMRAQRRLSPRFFLVVNVLQTTFWVVMFILSMVGAKTVLSIGINVIVLFSFIGLLIYASVIYHKQRKGTLRGTYAHAQDVEGHGLVNTTGYPAAYPPAAPVPHPYGDAQKPVAYSGVHPQHTAYSPPVPVYNQYIAYGPQHQQHYGS